MAYTEDNAFELIKSAYECDRLGHAFLIIGSEEDGSHRLASRIVTLLNSNSKQENALDLFGNSTSPSIEEEPKALDTLESDLVKLLRPEKKSRIISVEAMRNFEKSLYSVAPNGKWNIGIVEPADRMNEGSSNAFLKTLEEPPKQTLLILITSQPERLLPTILSRCLNIHLLALSSKPVTETETKILQSIATHCKNGFDSDISALKVKSAFTTLLNDRKAAILKANDQALKDEQSLYATTTDGRWLKERQEFYKAQSEIEYLLERSILIDTIVSWFGDILRNKYPFNHYDYPQIKSLTKQLSKTEKIESLLQRMTALENLRDALNTNTDEKTALEVGFMKALGK